MPAALAASLAVSTISSISGGISAQSAANQNAKLQEEQGGIALAQAGENATNEAYNQNQAVGKQRLAFLVNGVTLEGSPSAVLEQSKNYGQQQVNSILNQGAAQYNLAQEQATITKNQGRAALISSIGSAISTDAQGIYTLNKAGAFDPTKNTKAIGAG